MKLYVGNLPWSIDDKGLKELFTSYGDIEEAILIKDKFSGRSKGFGFVTFTDDSSAQKAVSEMHQKEVDGRPLTVSEARPMVPRDGAASSNEESVAPTADPSAINQDIEGTDDEAAPEVAEEDSSDSEEKIDTAEEAKEDASEDTPATEEATESEETTEEKE
jgi:cold-inducible RNA-binding protein